MEVDCIKTPILSKYIKSNQVDLSKHPDRLISGIGISDTGTMTYVIS